MNECDGYVSKSSDVGRVGVIHFPHCTSVQEILKQRSDVAVAEGW